MLKLSKKVEYGLMAVLQMDAENSHDPVSAKDLADRHSIPAELLGKVLQAMARAALVESAHGAHGGYRLARPLERLTLGDVVEAVDGPIRLVKCHEKPDQCDLHKACTIRDPVLRIQQQLTGYLYNFKLAEFRGWKAEVGSKK